MKDKMEKKTLLIVCAVIVFFLLAVYFGVHILAPLLEPVSIDMIKIFICGVACGILPGIWLGWKMDKIFIKEEKKF